MPTKTNTRTGTAQAAGATAELGAPGVVRPTLLSANRDVVALQLADFDRFGRKLPLW